MSRLASKLAATSSSIASITIITSPKSKTATKNSSDAHGQTLGHDHIKEWPRNQHACQKC